MSYVIGRGSRARETYPTSSRGQSPPFTPLLQTQWFVDEANVTGHASDANTGETINDPLLTDEARQRRWGLAPLLSEPRYDIWYLSGQPDVVLEYVRPGGTQLWLHGSGTAFQGQSILVAPAAITAHTVLAEATNTRPDITGGTANVHIADAGTPNQRLRLVTGTHTGAVAFAQKNTGASQAAVSQWTLPATYDPVTFVVPVEANPTNGDTYVVEALGQLGSLFINGISIDATGNQVGVTLDSLYAPNIGTNGFDVYGFLGCTSIQAVSFTNPSLAIAGVAVVLSSMVLGSIASALSFSLWDCSLMGVFSSGLAPLSGGTCSLNQHTIAQGCTAFDTALGGGVLVFNCGSFDSPADGARDTIGSASLCGPLWGSGNASAGFRALSRTQILTQLGGSVAALTIAGAADFALATVTVGRTWNNATGAYTEAGGVATRTTTWAHLAAAIGAGGFAGNAIDVATGASIVTT